METLRIIEHGNGHTDIEALIFGEWVVVKCIENTGETTMRARDYITSQDGNKKIQELKDKLFYVAPDFVQAIKTDAKLIDKYKSALMLIASMRHQGVVSAQFADIAEEALKS